MKILVDNNLSYHVAIFLDKVFKGSSHVETFGLDENTEDSEIWEFAKEKNFTILRRIMISRG